MKIVKRKGESVSPCRVPLCMESEMVFPWMFIEQVIEAEYRCLHAAMYESWIPQYFTSQKKTPCSTPSKAPLKSEQTVYMSFLDIVASSYIIMWVERPSYMFLRERKPSKVSMKKPSASLVSVPILVRMDVYSFSMQFITAIGLQLDGLCGSALFELYISLVALVHHFWGVQMCLTMVWNSWKVRSCAVPGRYFRIFLDVVSSLGGLPADAL